MNETDLSSHKLPPQNLEAEQSILGGILIENYAMNKVMEVLEPDDFYRESHRKIYKALIDLSERDEPADSITLTNELRKNGHLDLVGGASYIGRSLGAKKIVDEIAPKYKDRKGGYTRITKLPRRLSDGSFMAIIEFV